MDAEEFLQFGCNDLRFYLCFLSLLKVFFVIFHTCLGLFIQSQNSLLFFSSRLLFFLPSQNFIIRYDHQILSILLPFSLFFRLFAYLILSAHYLQRISLGFALSAFFVSSLAFPSRFPDHNCQNPQQQAHLKILTNSFLVSPGPL